MEISVEKAVELSKKLAIEIRKDFNPDIVIGIKEGGILPANEVSVFFSKPVYWIKVARISGEVEDRFNNDYKNADSETRKKVSQSFNETWFKSSPEIIQTEKFDFIKDKNVLVVDDAVHSGKTLDLILNHISRFKPTVVKTAALYYVDKYQPDFYLGKGEHRYPWSTWSKFKKDYAPYQEYLKNL